MIPLAPHKAWNCDTCNKLITDPELGLVVWREDDQHKAHGFTVVHKNLHQDDRIGCDPGDTAGYTNSLEIDAFIGDDGRARLLSYLHRGPLFEGTSESLISDHADYVDLFHRMQTPWYEEARPYFNSDHARELAAATGPTTLNSPKTLREIVEAATAET